MATRSDTASSYTLSDVRKFPANKSPAGHQAQALTALHKWFDQKAKVKGGILVLPTGGGKTFTATRYLTVGPLSQGHKVLWLAHTHHLLDQAHKAFIQPDGKGYEIGHVTGKRSELHFRKVSGTLGHGKVKDIKAKDDVVIITLQTLAKALQDGRHAGLTGFLNAANQSGLTIVFDECHHAPAQSYRKLIQKLREHVPNLHLLGLTATPTYTDERRQGALKQLFPQGLLYQVDTQKLMAQGILSRPHIEEAATQIEAKFEEADYQAWLGTYRDLPEKVVAALAGNAERNGMIADTYAKNKEKYGKTIIFADRVDQCIALAEFLRTRGVKAAAVFSHQDANLGSSERRNARRADENHAALEAFKAGELDVLVNIRMLTEGTDVPGVQTVFLTRQTTSRILLTQMIGRALRGPKFGGTKDAYIVSFIDQWKQHVAWARWDDLVDAEVEDRETALRESLPIEWVSIELIEHLAQALDKGQGSEMPFLTLLPVGWYSVEFSTVIQDDAAESTESVRQLIPVFDQDQKSFEQLLGQLPKHTQNSPFSDTTVSDAEQNQIRLWVDKYFDAADRLTHLEQDVLYVLRHWGQNGMPPKFTPFEARDEHDLDRLARDLSHLGRIEENDALKMQFAHENRLWRVLYPTFEQFRSQYNFSVDRFVAGAPEDKAPVPDLAKAEAPPEDDELDDKIKREIKARDGRKCLCCGSTYRLQVDHIRPRYIGGTHDPENLQTLCTACNNLKGTAEINFRTSKVKGKVTPISVPWRFTGDVNDVEALERLVRRVVNMHYGCAAVQQVAIGQRGQKAREWEVALFKGHKPNSVLKALEEVRQHVNAKRAALRRLEVDAIYVYAG